MALMEAAEMDVTNLLNRFYDADEADVDPILYESVFFISSKEHVWCQQFLIMENLYKYLPIIHDLQIPDERAASVLLEFKRCWMDSLRQCALCVQSYHCMKDKRQQSALLDKDFLALDQARIEDSLKRTEGDIDGVLAEVLRFPEVIKNDAVFALFEKQLLAREDADIILKRILQEIRLLELPLFMLFFHPTEKLRELMSAVLDFSSLDVVTVAPFLRRVVDLLLNCDGDAESHKEVSVADDSAEGLGRGVEFLCPRLNETVFWDSVTLLLSKLDKDSKQVLFFAMEVGIPLGKLCLENLNSMSVACLKILLESERSHDGQDWIIPSEEDVVSKTRELCFFLSNAVLLDNNDDVNALLAVLPLFVESVSRFTPADQMQEVLSKFLEFLLSVYNPGVDQAAALEKAIRRLLEWDCRELAHVPGSLLARDIEGIDECAAMVANLHWVPVADALLVKEAGMVASRLAVGGSLPDGSLGMSRLWKKLLTAPAHSLSPEMHCVIFRALRKICFPLGLWKGFDSDQKGGKAVLSLLRCIVAYLGKMMEVVKTQEKMFQEKDVWTGVVFFHTMVKIPQKYIASLRAGVKRLVGAINGNGSQGDDFLISRTAAMPGEVALQIGAQLLAELASNASAVHAFATWQFVFRLNRAVFLELQAKDDHVLPADIVVMWKACCEVFRRAGTFKSSEKWNTTMQHFFDMLKEAWPKLDKYTVFDGCDEEGWEDDMNNLVKLVTAAGIKIQGGIVEVARVRASVKATPKKAAPPTSGSGFCGSDDDDDVFDLTQASIHVSDADDSDDEDGIRVKEEDNSDDVVVIDEEEEEDGGGVPSIPRGIGGGGEGSRKSEASLPSSGRSEHSSPSSRKSERSLPTSAKAGLAPSKKRDDPYEGVCWEEVVPTSSPAQKSLVAGKRKREEEGGVGDRVEPLWKKSRPSGGRAPLTKQEVEREFLLAQKMKDREARPWTSRTTKPTGLYASAPSKQAAPRHRLFKELGQSRSLPQSLPKAPIKKPFNMDETVEKMRRAGGGRQSASTPIPRTKAFPERKEKRRTMLIDDTIKRAPRRQEEAKKPAAVTINEEKDLKKNLLSQILSLSPKMKMPKSTNLPKAFTDYAHYKNVFIDLLCKEWTYICFFRSRKKSFLERFQTCCVTMTKSTSYLVEHELRIQGREECQKARPERDHIIMVRYEKRLGGEQLFFFALVTQSTIQDTENVLRVQLRQKDAMHSGSQCRITIVGSLSNIFRKLRNLAAACTPPGVGIRLSDHLLNPVAGRLRTVSDHRSDFSLIDELALKPGFFIVKGGTGTGKTDVLVKLVQRRCLEARQASPVCPSPMRRTASSDGLLRTPSKDGKRGGVLITALMPGVVAELSRRLRGAEVMGRKLTVVHVEHLPKLVARRCNDGKGSTAKSAITQPSEADMDSLLRRLTDVKKKIRENRHNNDIRAKYVEEEDRLDAERTRLKKIKDMAEKRHREEVKRAADTANAILSEADVVACPLNRLEDLKKYKIRFSLVAIDNAGQAPELATLAALLFSADTCVLAGDLIHMHDEKVSEPSLFSRMVDCEVQGILLDTQYRMHTEIHRLPASLFYANMVKDGPHCDQTPARMTRLLPYQFFDLEFLKQEYESSAEASYVCRIVKALYALPKKARSRVAVLTPYNGQKRVIEKKLSGEDLPDLMVSIIDDFQGREADVVVVSCVRPLRQDKVGHDKVINDQRLHCLLTRARSSLLLVGSSSWLRENSRWKKVVEDADQRGMLQRVRSPKQTPVLFEN